MNSNDVVTFVEGWYNSATDEGRAKFRNWLLTLLGSEIVTITFTKKSGESRIMRCTTMANYVGDVVSSIPSEYLCTVWDVDANGWRSFRYDAITDLSFNLL